MEDTKKAAARSSLQFELIKRPKYMGLTKTKRKEVLIKSKRCFKCLTNGHRSTKCKKNCRICGEKHHWTLFFKGNESKIVKGVGMLTTDRMSVSLKTFKV